MGIPIRHYLPFLVAQTVKNVPAIRETQVQSLDWEDPLEENGYPLQYSCLENPMNRGAWRARVHGVRVPSQQDWGLTVLLFHPVRRQTFLKICSFFTCIWTTDKIFHEILLEAYCVKKKNGLAWAFLVAQWKNGLAVKIIRCD